jgi:hypothetical protein
VWAISLAGEPGPTQGGIARIKHPEQQENQPNQQEDMREIPYAVDIEHAE